MIYILDTCLFKKSHPLFIFPPIIEVHLLDSRLLHVACPGSGADLKQRHPQGLQLLIRLCCSSIVHVLGT